MTESSGKVEIYLNLPDFSDAFSRELVQLIAADIKNIARELVRWKTHALQNSIKIIKNKYDTWVLSEEPYGAAQEFGRPDLPNYGFTPHMRPASVMATEDALIRKDCDSAWQSAIKKAYKNGGGE
jgi:hypothetical protein